MAPGAFVCTAGPGASLSRPRARTQEPGKETESVLCVSFFQPSPPKQKKKKSHLKRPRDPLRSQLPTSGLSRAAAALTHARSSQHPAPRFRVPAAAAAAASRPAKPPSSLRAAVEGAAPARALGTRPRRRARAAPLSAAGLGSRRCPRAGGEQAALPPGDPREGALPLGPLRVRLGPQAWLARGLRFPRGPLPPPADDLQAWGCHRVWERKSPETRGEG